MLDPARPIEGEGKGGGRAPQEQKNTLFSRSIARVLHAISEGECEGLADSTYPLKSIYFDKTVIMNPDGTRNFEGIEAYQRRGGIGQSPVEGFKSVEVVEPDGTIVSKDPDAPAIHTFTVNPDEGFNQVTVVIEFPNGLSKLETDSGDLISWRVKYKLEIQAKKLGGSYGDWVVVADGSDDLSYTSLGYEGSIQGKQTGSFRFGIQIPLLMEELGLDAGDSEDWPGAEYKVKLSRLTKDASSEGGPANLTGQMKLHSIVKSANYALSYDNTALVATVIDSWFFDDQIRQMLFDWKGIRCLVPSNYDPLTRRYTGIWDGVLKREWTDNPAWVLYNLLTTRRYGLGKQLATAHVNKWKLYAFAQYCDAVVPGTLPADVGDMIYTNDNGDVVGGVPNGIGGVEPRMTFNGSLYDRMEAYDAIKLFASVMMAQVYWGNGTVEFSQDAPADPVMVFNPANIVDGMIERAGDSARNKRSVIVVKWRDPDRFGEVRHEVVEDNELIARYGQREHAVTAFGCTSRGQAQRFGRRLLYDQLYGEVVSWKAGFDAANLRPGDTVYLQDPYGPANETLSGRFRLSYDVLGTIAVILDEAVAFDSGVNYTIHSLNPDGEITHGDIINPNGTTATLVLNSWSNGVPNIGAVYAIERDDIEMEQVRIVSVVPNAQDGTIEVSGVTHDPDKYAFIEDGVKYDPPIISNYPSGNLVAPINLSVTESLYKNGPTVMSKATLSWEDAPLSDNLHDPRISFYEIQWKPPFSEDGEGDWEPVPGTAAVQGKSVDITDTQYGIHKFRVRARSTTFMRSPWSQELSVNLRSLTDPPSDVQDFRGIVTGESLKLMWSTVPDLDLDHYEIRYTPETTGATWAEAQVEAANVAGTAQHHLVSAANGTYFIKAVDQRGNYSVNSSSMTSNFRSAFSYNVVETFTENNAQWGGTMTDIIELQDYDGAEPPNPLGTYSLYLEGGNNMSAWPDLASVSVLQGGADYASVGTYLFSNTIDLGAVYESRATYDMQATVLNKNNVMASWPRLDTLYNLAGTVEGEVQTVLQASISELDVTAANSGGDTGDPTTGWSDWEVLVINNYRARSFRFRLILTTTNSDITPVINSCSITVDMPDRIITNTDKHTSSPGGPLTIDYASDADGDFIGPTGVNTYPSVFITAYDMAKDDYFVVSNQGVDGFDIEFFDSLGSTIAKDFDWMAKGYGRVIT